MFAVEGDLIIRKPFWKFDEFIEQLQRDVAAHGNESMFVIHFRWATHGALTAVNTHPHPLCGGRVGLVHNGVFSNPPPDSANISDTVYFCRTVLANRQPSQLLGRRFRNHLENEIGTNRLVFMDWRGEVSIVNAAMGDWIDGVWFSNLNFLLPKRWVTPGGQSYAAVPFNQASLPYFSETKTANDIVADCCAGEREEDDAICEQIEAWREYETCREQIEAWGEIPRRTSKPQQYASYPIGG